MSQKEKDDPMTLDHEELDYEVEEVDNFVKKNSSVTLEIEDNLEEGEILDEDSDDYADTQICRAYKFGSCQSGDQCPYLHVTDKGLYRMLELPTLPSIPPPHLSPPPFQLQLNTVKPVVNASSFDNCEQYEMSPTAWDRALIEAQKLVKKWDAHVNRTIHPVVITIDSDNEQPSNKSSKKSRCYKFPEPKVIPYTSSLSSKFRGSSKSNTVDNKKECEEVQPSNKSTKKPRCYKSLKPKVIPRTSSLSSRGSPKSNTNKNKKECEEVQPSNKSTKKPRCYKSPEPKVIPLTSSLSSKFRGSPKSNTLENKKECEEVQPSNKSTKKPRCYKSPEPKVIPLTSSLSSKFRGSPKSNTLENKECEEVQPSNKSTKKPRCYKSPEPKVILQTSFLSRKFRGSPKSNTFENKECQEVKWDGPWIQSAVHRTKLPVSSSKIRQKESSVSSSSSECSCKWCHRRKEDCLSISEQRNRESVVKDRHRETTCRSSSRSFTPASVYRSMNIKTETKMGPEKIEEKKSPTTENSQSRKFKLNKPTKKDSSSFTSDYAENWHKAIPRRSPSPASMHQSRSEKRGTSVKKRRKISPIVNNKFDRNFKPPNKSIKKSLSSLTPVYEKNHHKVLSCRSSSRSPEPTSAYHTRNDKSKKQAKSHSELQKRSIFFDAVNNAEKKSKIKEPVKKDLPLLIPARAKNYHKANFSRYPSRSCRSASVYSSIDRKSKNRTELQYTKRQKNTDSNVGRHFKIKKAIEKEFRLPTFSHKFDVPYKWPPRKVRSPSPPMESCSDMSISPLSDSELSDLFDPGKSDLCDTGKIELTDPGKRANKLYEARHRETSRSRTFLSREKHSAEVSDPICPNTSQSVALSISVVPNCEAKKEAANLPKPPKPKEKKRNFCALENDLFKFQRQRRIVLPQPTLKKNGIQRSAEVKTNKALKKDVVNQTLGTKEEANETLKDTPVVQRKQISKKEMIVKQLKEIDAALQKMKQQSRDKKQ